MLFYCAILKTVLVSLSQPINCDYCPFCIARCFLIVKSGDDEMVVVGEDIENK